MDEHLLSMWTATLSANVVVDGTAEDLGLVIRFLVQVNIGEAGTLNDPLSCRIVAGLQGELTILGVHIVGRHVVVDFVDCGLDVGGLPSVCEVVIKVRSRRLEKEAVMVLASR